MSPIYLGDAIQVPSNDATFRDSVIQPLRSHHVSGPYDDCVSYADELPYVPPLRYFLIRRLAEFPEQAHLLGSYRCPYERPSNPSSVDLILALIPYDEDSRPDLSAVDPRLWVTIVQLFERLPKELLTYTLPLADQHLPILQQIVSTPHFSMVTVLELPACRELNDSSISKLRELRTLCALDISSTSVSPYGIRQLCLSLSYEFDHSTDAFVQTGPCALRILRLRKCREMTNDVYALLAKFPILSVVDLRGTYCSVGGIPEPFRSSRPRNELLYFPTRLAKSLQALHDSSERIFSSSNTFFININSLTYPDPSLRHTINISRRQRQAMGRHSLSDLRGVRSDEMDMFHKAAHDELRREAERQRVMTFYSLKKPLKHAGRSSKGVGENYCSDDYFVERPRINWPGKQSIDDSWLMLYRPPPPWIDLLKAFSTKETALSASLPPRRQSLGRKAILNVNNGIGFQRAQMLKEQVTGMVQGPPNKRRKSDENLGSNSQMTVLPRNPFRRSVGAGTSGSSVPKAPFSSRVRMYSSSAALDSEPLSATAEMSSPKDMKLISDIQIPSLPETEMKKLKAAAAQENRKQGSIKQPSKTQKRKPGQQRSVDSYFKATPG